MMDIKSYTNIHKYQFIPMCFMLIVTICSLIQTIVAQVTAGRDIWCYIQALVAALLVVLAVVLAVIAFRTLVAQADNRSASQITSNRSTRRGTAMTQEAAKRSVKDPSQHSRNNRSGQNRNRSKSRKGRGKKKR